MNKYDSWEITDFNIDGHIALSQKFGHLKMMRTDDGTLILVTDADYGLIDQTQPTRTNFFNADTALGFVLDIGVRREKHLSGSSGFYFGSKYVNPQSQKKISQANFDQVLFEDIGDVIQTNFQSDDPIREIEAVKFQFLLDEYNNALLMYPNFHSESYLSLMRIIDALTNARGACDYAVFCAQISQAINTEVYTKVFGMEVYLDRHKIAIDIFNDWHAKATSKNWNCLAEMSAFDDAAKFVFASFISAYQYRNKFVHQGFPFPDVVKQSLSFVGEDNGLAYISPTLGQSWIKFNRPGGQGLQPGDLIDIHEIVGANARDFQDKYFLLVPTWHFLKRMTKEALLLKMRSL